MSTRKRILKVRDLSVSFATDNGPAKVIEDVSFSVEHGRTLGLVGESGCGKSVTAMSIIRLLPSPPSRVESGRIFFNGHDLLELDDAAMRNYSGQSDRYDFPGTDDEPQSDLFHRFSNRRSSAPSSRAWPQPARDAVSSFWIWWVSVRRLPGSINIPTSFPAVSGSG